MLERAKLVLERAAGETSVDHDAEIPAGCQRVGRHRSVHEVELRRAGVLVQAEGQLELADLEASDVELPIVGVDVAPRVVARQLALDLELHAARDLSADADPPSGDIVWRFLTERLV